MKRRYLLPMILSTVLCILMYFVFYYLSLPAINIKSNGLWWYALVCIFTTIFIYPTFCVLIGKILKVRIKEYVSVKIPIIATVAFTIIFIIVGAFGVKEFRDEDYKKLANVTISTSENEMLDSTFNPKFVIGIEQAVKIGEETLKNNVDFSSYSISSDYTLISIKGEPYWIAPLNRSKTSLKKIPGYMLINGYTKEAKFVEVPEKINYSTSEIFLKNIKRHLRTNYPNDIIGKAIFEVDDNFVPYWISAVRVPTIGISSGEVTTSAIVTNAITGETKKYKLSEVPDFVDNINSVDYLMDILEDKYNIHNSDSERHIDYDEARTLDGKAREGYSGFIDKNGKVCYSTSITNTKPKDKLYGFVLTNPRTQEFRLCKNEGLLEEKIIEDLTKKINNGNVNITYPGILNIKGKFVYIMYLHNNEEDTDSYALVDTEEKFDPFIGNSVEEVVKQYCDRMCIKPESEDKNEQPKEQKKVEKQEEQKEVKPEEKKVENLILKAKVTDVKEVITNNSTTYLFKLEGSDLIFSSSISTSLKQAFSLTKGNVVEIEYILSSEEGVADVKKIKF